MTALPAAGLYELGLVPQKDIPRLQRIAEFVEKYQIIQPDNEHWGIYYDIDARAARCYPRLNLPPNANADAATSTTRPTFAASDLNCRSGSETHHGPFENTSRPEIVSRMSECADENMEDFEEINWQHESDKINTYLISLERRQLVDGLHYLRAAPSDGVFSRLDCPRLLIDTGSSITWIFGKHAKVLRDSIIVAELARPEEVTPPVDYRARPNSYAGEARKVPNAMRVVPFGDNFKALLQLYRGDMYLAPKWDKDRRKYNVLPIPDFTFAVAIATHDPRAQKVPQGNQGNGLESKILPDQIDGHLALAPGHRIAEFSQAGQPDLFVEKLGEIMANREEPGGFTLAFGLDASRTNRVASLMSSWISFGPEDVRSKDIPHKEWTGWLPICEAMDYFWAPYVVGASIGQGPYIPFNLPGSDDGTGVPIVLDTGSEMSALPAPLADAMDDTLGCTTRGVSGDGLIPPARQTTQAFHQNIYFYFANGVTVGGPLSRFVDQRNSRQFWTGYRASNRQDPADPYVLGNMFFRGIVADFQYNNGPCKGKVRFADRRA
ncbi:Peptidase A1 domain-containing protein [Mycena chlorophos]|uniref:Peptidase A1 domain-containing protein n=1 Tax=Mycena chlorophos TaxID=658473 RepID=A0A8H6VUC2_MYCCL|nr:Peptidase A1 domain-containing protein [Mycena chlorophos]